MMRGRYLLPFAGEKATIGTTPFGDATTISNKPSLDLADAAIDATKALSRVRTVLPTTSRKSIYTLRHPSMSTKLADGDLRPLVPSLSLRGKNFVVTGGGRGIGYAATRAIAEMGGNVSVLDVLPEPVEDFEQLSSEFGVKSLYINTDVTKQESLATAFEQTAKEFGGIDGWYVCRARPDMGKTRPHYHAHH
jgi:hypothetical protein